MRLRELLRSAVVGAREECPGEASGLRLLVGLLAVFAAQYAFVRPTNFGGADEWLYIDLCSRGILGVPYAHRPLVLLWTAPASVLWPHSLWSYWFFYGGWLLLGGWAFALCLRRLLPDAPDLAYLAGVFALVWAPLDFLRLDTVLLTGYAGFTLGALLAILLFLESHHHRSWVLFTAGSFVAALSARGFEGAIPLMASAPLLLLWARRPPDRRFWIQAAIWMALIAILLALVARDFLGGSDQGAYQGSALRIDPHPGRVAMRVLEQFSFHLLPLVTGPFGPASAALGVALAAFAVVAAVLLTGEVGRKGRLMEAAGIGLGLAALGYLPLMLSASILGAARTQVLAAPGIGLFLAALVCLVALRFRRRRLVAGLLAGFVVARGADRTLTLQREWDAVGSRYPAQHAALTAIVNSFPRVVPRTFFILLVDDTAAWPATFTFRHALRYLYAGAASGQVVGPNVTDFLYPMAMTPSGIQSVPWPVIRHAWDEPPRLYRHEEVVVFRARGTAPPELVLSWPVAVLGALPPGARYEPRARLLASGPEVPARGILRTTPPVAVKPSPSRR
jgi:hypothetical protein